MGMAKRTVKKARNSGKSKSGGKQKADAIPPEPLPVQKKPRPAQKKPEILCQFCGKAMKDEKTRKIHERNCKTKSREQPPAKKEKNLESAFLELKDRFEDERQNMAKTFIEREDHLQRELEEVKTVLRLEIDRHRRELERISKVEREVAENQAQHEHATREEPVPAKEPEIPAPEPIHAPRSQPKAIDLIPMRMPTFPRKRPAPIEDEDPIPDLDEDRPAKPAAPGLDRAAVEAMVRELLMNSGPAAPAEPVKVDDKIAIYAGRLEAMEARLERAMSEVRKYSESKGKDVDAKRVEKELEKVSEKVQDIMEDSGYGESLSVAKIPPTILEIVYQAILDDVHLEIIRTKGAQDAERLARSALEEVRLKTSGSELFKFDGRKIVTDSLARSIESNMISAKQIQTTYDVLMEKLLETVPHHKAKNFKGMIKIKSQEFAVDRATKLTKELAKVEKQLDSTSHMVAAMAANVSAQTLAIHEKIDQINDKGLAAKADREDVESLRAKLEEANERIIRLADELALLRAEAEMKSSIKEKESEEPGSDNSDVFLAPGEEPYSMPDVPDGGVFTTKPQSPTGPGDEAPAVDGQSQSKDAETVFSAVSGGAGSKTAIIKKTGLEDGPVIRALEELVSAKKIIEKKSGKRITYTTLELELGKLKEEEMAKPEKGKAGKKKKSPVKQDEPEHAAELPEPEPVPSKPEPEKEEATVPEPPVEVHISKPGVVVLGDSDEDDVPPPEKAAKPKRKGKKKARKAETELESKPETTVSELKSEPETTVSKPESKSKAPVSKLESKSKAPVSKLETKSKAPVPEPEPKSKAPVPEPEPESAAIDDIPVVRKTMSELSKEELEVLDAIGEGAMTLSGIQSKVGKHLKRFALLRALRVLIDSGHVGVTAKGRMELYHKITVQQMDESDNRKNKKEVK